MNDLRFWKAIFEIRFPPSSFLFDNRGAIASKWQWIEDLSEWRISDNQVTIHNKNNTTFLNTGLRNLNVVMEFPRSASTFIDQAHSFSEFILDILQIRQIDRIGLRIIQLSNQKHFKLLFSKMKQNLYRISDDYWEKIGAIPEDLAVSFTLKINDNRANFNAGPMTKDQLLNYFESNEVKEKLPRTSLFVDVDIFRNSPEFEKEDFNNEIRNFLEDGCLQIENMGTSFYNEFGGFE
jgi:hypothetical protein